MCKVHVKYVQLYLFIVASHSSGLVEYKCQNVVFN